MNWYKTGTISVANGNSAITGSGTAWVANAAAGEAVYCPDGRFYEIQSVNSDTSITIAGNYSGATLSGQSYTILPSQSFIRDLAAQAAELINSYASIANAAGAGKFGDGTLGAPGISFVNDTNTGIRRTADGTFRLVANGVDIVEIGPGVVTMLAGAKVVAPRFDMDGWHLASYSGTELRRGNWESAGEWTEVSDYIHGVKRSSLTAGGLSIVGEISTPTGDAQALVLGKNQGGGAKLSYNTGTGNLDVTPRSGYNVHVIGALGVSGAATLSAGASLPLPSIGGSTSIEFPYYGDANAKTRIVAASTSDHRQTLKIQMNTAQSDSAPVDVVVFDASGNVGVGGALTSAGVLNLLFGNIQFPANQNASGDANTLDDYEEGSWTPVIRGSGTAGTYQTSTATGTYTKIGNLVTLICAITGLNPTGGGTGDMQITGLPFPKANGANACGGGLFHIIGLSTPTSISFSTRGASSILYVCGMSGNSAVVAPISGFVNGSIIDFSISYNV